MLKGPAQYSLLYQEAILHLHPTLSLHLSLLLQVPSHYSSACLFGPQFILPGTAVLFPVHIGSYKGPMGLHTL